MDIATVKMPTRSARAVALIDTDVIALAQAAKIGTDSLLAYRKAMKAFALWCTIGA